MKKETKTVNLFGRDIPLTKSGEINRTHLRKDEKKAYDECVEQARKDKKEDIMNELRKFFGK